MKRGTLLLIVALTMQGLTPLTLLGTPRDEKLKLSHEERQERREKREKDRQRKLAKKQKEQKLKEALFTEKNRQSDSIFKTFFGSQPKSSEKDQKESIKAPDKQKLKEEILLLVTENKSKTNKQIEQKEDQKESAEQAQISPVELLEAMSDMKERVEKINYTDKALLCKNNIPGPNESGKKFAKRFGLTNELGFSDEEKEEDAKKETVIQEAEDPKESVEQAQQTDEQKESDTKENDTKKEEVENQTEVSKSNDSGWLKLLGLGLSDDKSSADEEKEVLDTHKAKMQNVLESVQEKVKDKEVRKANMKDVLKAAQEKAKEVKANYNKVTASEILEEQEQNGMLPVLKMIKNEAGKIKAKRQRNLQEKLFTQLKEKKQTPSTGEEFFNFEDGSTRQRATTQNPHNALWKKINNPSSPTSIITLLQQNQVPDNEVMDYQSYVAKAINSLAQAFKDNHEQRKTAPDVQTRQAICKQNQAVAIQLITILQLAKERNLIVSNEAQEMTAYWLEENNRAIEELLQAEDAEVKEFCKVQAPDFIATLLGNHTLKGRVKRFRQVKPGSFVSGSNRTENMKQVMEIASNLAEELNSGESNLTNTMLFVMTLKEKGISLDLDSLTELRNALIKAQNTNNEQLADHASHGLLFDDRAEQLSSTLSDLMSEFTAVVRIEDKKTDLIDYVNQFEDWNDNSENECDAYWC